MHDYLLSRFGPTMSYEQLSIITHRKTKTLKNDYSQGKLIFPSFRFGRTRLFNTFDVAIILEAQSQLAKETLEEEKLKLNTH